MAAARHRRLETTAGFCRAISAIAVGTVKTTWKYSQARMSACRWSIHARPRQRLAGRTMSIPTAVVPDARLSTAVALLDMPAQGGGHADGAGGQLPTGGHVDLVRPNLLRAQGVRRLPDVPSELGDVVHIRPLGMRGELPHLHVFEQASSEGGHGTLLCEGRLGDSRRSQSSVWEDQRPRPAARPDSTLSTRCGLLSTDGLVQCFLSSLVRV